MTTNRSIWSLRIRKAAPKTRSRARRKNKTYAIQRYRFYVKCTTYIIKFHGTHSNLINQIKINTYLIQSRVHVCFTAFLPCHRAL